MNVLTEHGLIERHSFADGRARYEAGGSEHHDHFVNVETDEVIEFTCEEIERLQQKIADEHGFEIVGHKLEIYVKHLAKGAGRQQSSRPPLWHFVDGPAVRSIVCNSPGQVPGSGDRCSPPCFR